MHITFSCEVCGVAKTTPAAWFKKSKRHTCSRACASRLTRTGKARPRPEARKQGSADCANCGAEIVRWVGAIREGNNFCGRKCVADYWRGRERGPYRPVGERLGMTYRKGGYVYEFTNDPRSSNGYVLQHRLVVEMADGRALGPDEHVHHVNGDKADNRRENLVVVTHAEHMALHAEARRSG